MPTNPKALQLPTGLKVQAGAAPEGQGVAP